MLQVLKGRNLPITKDFKRAWIGWNWQVITKKKKKNSCFEKYYKTVQEIDCAQKLDTTFLFSLVICCFSPALSSLLMLSPFQTPKQILKNTIWFCVFLTLSLSNEPRGLSLLMATHSHAITSRCFISPAQGSPPLFPTWSRWVGVALDRVPISLKFGWLWVSGKSPFIEMKENRLLLPTLE